MHFATIYVLIALSYLGPSYAIPVNKTWRRDNLSTTDAVVLTPEQQVVQDGFVNAVNGFLSNDTFVFANPAYLALQEYITAGLALPNSNENFENQYTLYPATIGDDWYLRTLDQKIYWQSENAMVTTGQHCTDFVTNTSPLIMNLAGGLDSFAKLASDGFASITAILPSITPDLKKTDLAKYNAAVSGFNTTLVNLLAPIPQLLDDCTQIEQNLNDFQGVTISDQQALIDMSSAVNPLAQEMADYVSMTGQVSELSWQGVSQLWQKYVDAKPGKDKKAAADTYNDGVKFAMAINDYNRQANNVLSGDLNPWLSKALDRGDLLTNIDASLNMLDTAKNAFSKMEVAIQALQLQLINADNLTVKFFISTLFSSRLQAAGADWAIVQTQAAAFVAAGSDATAGGN